MTVSGGALALGVDVGGTFTKAVAVPRWGGGSGPVAVQSVPTTHHAAQGVAEGAVEALLGVVAALGGRRADVELVAISTTQAVNALLEGDVATVGILAMADRAHLRRTGKRSRLRPVPLAPGRELTCRHTLLDVTEPPDEAALDAALDALAALGAEAVVVTSAFGVDDPTLERRALERAAARGLPACAGHELSGLYGLELRTQTAAVNASILPAMERTARHVREALDRAGLALPRLLIRGDGGATPLDRLTADPIRTLFSGPAASVAGAVQAAGVSDALVVEHGGTSTNVAVVSGGRPALDYVRIERFATCVRALDVRVVGIAGGSLVRADGRRRYALGPRSAHHAGLPYAAFAPALEDAEAVAVAPRQGDPPAYLVARCRDGRAVAVTPTCFANALELLASGDPAHGDPAAAAVAVQALARQAGRPWRDFAADALDGAARAILEVARPLLEAHPAACRTVVTAGGAAGVLGPAVARVLGAEECRAPHAAVLSSIGAALSLVRAEAERTIPDAAPATSARIEAELVAAARAEAERGGADPATVEVHLEHDRARGTARAVAVGRLGRGDRGSTPPRGGLGRLGDPQGAHRGASEADPASHAAARR